MCKYKVTEQSVFEQKCVLWNVQNVQSVQNVTEKRVIFYVISGQGTNASLAT